MFPGARFVLVFPLLSLAACVETPGFGGSGGSAGSDASGIALARDVCTRTLRDEGALPVRIDRAEEYGFGTGGPRGVKVDMTIRRDALSVSTEQRVCRFSYATGTADISRT